MSGINNSASDYGTSKPDVDDGLAFCDGLCTWPEQLSEDEIQAKIDLTFSKHAEIHVDRIKRYARLRQVGDDEDYSPRHAHYQDAVQKSQTIRTVFMLDRVRSRTWVYIWYWDFFYFALQQHPILGFFEKGPHPMTMEDRVLVVVGGTCAAILNSATMICNEALCLNETDPLLQCHSTFLNNGVCDDGGNVTFLGTMADPKNPCDFGHDCGDCGPRNEFDYQRMTFQYWGHVDGIRCFDSNHVLYWNLMWALFCAMIMVSVKQAIMCKCFLWGNNEFAALAIDMGQTLGVLIVAVMCLFAGSVIGSVGIDWWGLLKCKVLAYTFSIIGIAFVYIISSQKEHARIHMYRNIENYILVTTRLYPEEEIEFHERMAKKGSIDSEDGPVDSASA